MAGRRGSAAATLVELTEGWPIGLYFAGLALRIGRPAGHRDQLRRGRPVPGRLPAVRAVRPALAGRDRVPDQDVGGGADLRAAVRRDRRRHRLGPPAGGAGTAEPAGDPARPAPRVVPVPPPVPGPAAGRAAPPRARAGPAAAPARGRLAGGELPAGRGHRARAGGGRRRPRRPARPRPDAAGLGERAGRDGAALDDLVRPGPRDRALPGDRRARRADLRADGPVGGGGAAGGRRRAGPADRDPAGRQHDGRPARLPAGHPRPGRCRGDAPGRRAGLRRAAADQPVPGDDAAHRGRLPPAGRRARAGRPAPRQRRAARRARRGAAAGLARPGRAVHRRRRSGTTGPSSTGTSTRRCRSCRRATSRCTGPARWSTRGPARAALHRGDMATARRYAAQSGAAAPAAGLLDPGRPGPGAARARPRLHRPRRLRRRRRRPPAGRGRPGPPSGPRHAAGAGQGAAGQPRPDPRRLGRRVGADRGRAAAAAAAAAPTSRSARSPIGCTCRTRR